MTSFLEKVILDSESISKPISESTGIMNAFKIYPTFFCPGRSGLSTIDKASYNGVDEDIRASFHHPH